MFRIATCAATLVVVLASVGDLPADRVQWSENDHYYEAVSVAPFRIDWHTAQAVAASRGGYLATINTAQENQFVFDLLGDFDDYWYDGTHDVWIGPWLGGFQPAGSIEPGGNWQWVTGERFTFQPWAFRQPDNGFNQREDSLHYFIAAGQPYEPAWNDYPFDGRDGTHGYIVEWGDPGPPVVWPDPDELIVNGGFEVPSISPDRWSNVTAGSTRITGWTVSSGDVDIVSVGHSRPYDGQQWLDLSGDASGEIEQSFSTNAGQAYELSFWYANNPSGSASGYDAEVTVTGNGTLLDAWISHSGSTKPNMKYQFFSEFFVADSSSTTLRFQSLTGGNAGIALDSVSVVVPEPSTLILLAVSSIGLIVYRRRRGR